MKTSRSNPSKQSSQGTSKKPQPNIREDLDSRKSKVKTKDRTAKTDKDEKVKTKKPLKKKVK
jgi:hypothetical protein